MAENKPRIFQDGKDITMTLLVIVFCMVFAVMFTGMCSFNPGAPENGPVQRVDAKQFLDIEARGMPFPVRYPQVPQEWTPNSARRTSVAGQPAPVVGWVTSQGEYVQLLQTDQPVDAAVSDHDDYARKERASRSIAGYEVVEFANEHYDARVLWVADLGQVRLVVSGTAGEEEYAQLMEAALEVPQLSPNADSTR